MVPALQQFVDISGLDESIAPLRWLQVATDPWLPDLHCARTELMIKSGTAGGSLGSLLTVLCSSMHASFSDLLASPECVQLKVGCRHIS